MTQTHLVVQQRNAGFFSDFNLIVACLHYFYDNSIVDFNVYWTSDLYQTTKQNMFDEYFFKNKKIHQFSNQFDIIHDVGVLGGSLWTHINEHWKFEKSHEVLKFYNYFENSVYKKCKDKCTKRNNSLGIHIRGTDHTQHGPLLDINEYYREIDKKLSNENYTSIFVATDELRILQACQQKYGDMVIYNDVHRSNTQQAIHLSNLPQKEQLAEDVLLDAISLSHCDDIIITSSNVSAYTLYLNPKIKHTFIDRHINYH